MTALAPGNLVGRELAAMYPELERFRERRDDTVQLFRKLRGIDYDEKRPADSELARYRRQITREEELLGDVDALLLHARSFSKKHRSYYLTEFNRELHTFDNETNALFSLLRDEKKKIIRAQRHESLLMGKIFDFITPANKWQAIGIDGALAGTVTGTPVVLAENQVAGLLQQIHIPDIFPQLLSQSPQLSNDLYWTSIVGFGIAGFSAVVTWGRYGVHKVHNFYVQKAAERKFLNGDQSKREQN